MALKFRAKREYSRDMDCLLVHQPTSELTQIPQERNVSKNADLQTRKNPIAPRGVGVMCDFYAERAENAELWDVEGRRFIDFAAGIAVCNTGHRHPKILAAIRDQLDHFTHTAYQIVPYASYVELAEKINRRAPG